jgi:hypothetical protein
MSCRQALSEQLLADATLNVFLAVQVAQVVLGLPYEVTLLNMPRDQPSGQVPKDGVFDKVKGISTGTIALLTEYLQTGNVY